jgi:hypothetical protein
MSRETFDGAAGAILPQIARNLFETATIVVNTNHPYLSEAWSNASGQMLSSTKLEWQDYSPRARSVTTATGAQDTTGDTTITCSEDVSALVFVGDELEVDGTDEKLLVTAVSSTNLTVTRGYGGTVKATIPSGTTLHIISQAALEGEAYVDRGNYGATQRYNYTQIFKTGFEISGTLEAIQFATSLEGRRTQLGVDIMNHMTRMMQLAGSTVLRGVAPASTTQGSATVRRTMNGIQEMIREGSSASEGAIYSDISSSDFNSSDAYDNLTGHVKNLYDLGADTDLIVVNSAIAQQLATNQKGGRQMYSEDRANRVFRGINTNFGMHDLLIDSFMPNDAMLITKRGAAAIHWLRPFFIEPLAKVGDSQRWQIVSEFTLKVQNAATGGHSWLYNASV